MAIENLNDHLGDAEAKSYPLSVRLSRGLDGAEQFEQVLLFFFVNANAIVFNLNLNMSVFTLLIFDHLAVNVDSAEFVGELDCIRKKIEKHLLKPSHI